MLQRSRRVLIVDDDREDAEMVADLWEEVTGEALQFVWAPSYEEGLKRLRAEEVDVCLLDYRLGARSGIDFLGEPSVRESAVPIIFMTGRGTPEVDRQAMEAGAVDLLSKEGLTGVSLERAVRYAAERRRREEAEAVTHALVGTLQEIVSVLGPDATIRYVSPSIRRILGFEGSEKVGRNALADVHPDDLGEVEEALRRVLEEPGARVEMRHRLRNAEGGWRTLDTVAVNYLGDPVLRGIVVSSRDITERLEREEFVRFQASLLKAVGQAVIATDLAGRVIYWNPMAEALYGWTAEEALHEEVLSLNVTPSTKERASEIMQAVRSEGVWTGEFGATRKDGSTFLALVSLSLILDARGEPVGQIGVSSDITGLKETEAALRERVKELRTLTQASEILNRSDRALRTRLASVVELIPQGWLDPAQTEARLILGNRTFQTEGFRETPWMDGVNFTASDVEGRLEVALTSPRTAPGAEASHTPFLPEEHELLENLGRILGEAIGRATLQCLVTRAFRSIGEAVLVMDGSRGGRGIRYVNPAAEQMFGWDAAELEGGDTAPLHPDEEAFRRFGEESRRVLEAEGVFHGSFPLRRRDGSIFQAEQTVTLLDPELGHEGGVVSVVRDVSQQREAEARLRESEERFGVLSQEITDAIYVLSGNGIVQTASPSVHQATGYLRGEVEGRDMLEFVHPDDRDAVREKLAEIAGEAGRSARLEYRILTKEGEVRYIESVGRNLLENPAVGGILLTSRDVGERLTLERQLRQMQKMESVGQLAGGIAHDFNNILTVIRAQTDLLLLDLPPGPAAEEASLIQAAADRAATLTGQLLAFSREQLLQPRIVDLARVVRDAGRLIDRLIGEDVRVVYRLAEGLSPIRVDPNQLEQVMLNLAVNARDAMPTGGTLGIAMEEREVDEEGVRPYPGLRPGRHVVLQVSDTGVGMTEPIRRRVFDPFFTTKPKGKGTGLGLAMVYGTVKQSGGGIYVESEPGQGATFTLWFPAVESGVAEEPFPPGAPGNPGPGPDSLPDGGRILVVEDDPAVRRVTVKVLEKVGHRVMEARDAEEGLAVLEEGGDFDVVISDLVLPGMSGMQLVERLRQVRPGLPVVVMSGYAEGAPGRGEELPTDVLSVPKPFTTDRMIAAVHEALARRRS